MNRRLPHPPTSGALALLVAAALSLLAPAAARAASCSLTMGTSIAFGAYDPLSPVALTTTGMLQYRCSRGQPIRITFSPGSSGDLQARTLRQGPWTLAYNLYADAGFGTIWGDGTGGTAAAPAVTTLSNGLTVAYVFGRIPAGQQPPVGPYADTIVVTFEF
jgi:spore coat protein U-like protein